MKSPCILVLFLIVTLPVFAQEKPEVWEVIDSFPRSQVPKGVQQAFKQRYPGIRPLFWFQLNDDYEAQFLISEHSMSAEFSKSGSWVNTETVIPEEEFNERVIEYIRKQYPGYELDTVILEESQIGKFLDATIVSEESEMELIFNTDGEFLRKGDAVE